MHKLCSVEEIEKNELRYYKKFIETFALPD